MKHLYFVRHGESVINLTDIFASKPGTENDSGLTDRGRFQAQQAGDDIITRGIKIDCIVSSPTKRTLETSQIIARRISFPAGEVKQDKLFIELQFGELEGTPWSAFWDSGKTYMSLAEIKDSETIESLQQRAEKALDFVKSIAEDNILIVSHSAFGRALRRAIEHKSWQDELTNHDSIPYGKIVNLI